MSPLKILLKIKKKKWFHVLLLGNFTHAHKVFFEQKCSFLWLRTKSYKFDENLVYLYH